MHGSDFNFVKFSAYRIYTIMLDLFPYIILLTRHTLLGSEVKPGDNSKYIGFSKWPFIK